MFSEPVIRRSADCLVDPARAPANSVAPGNAESNLDLLGLGFCRALERAVERGTVMRGSAPAIDRGTV